MYYALTQKQWKKGKKTQLNKCIILFYYNKSKSFYILAEDVFVRKLNSSLKKKKSMTLHVLELYYT